VSDRLKDLQRQRALQQEHLAWLDQEIAKEAGQAGASGNAIPVSPLTHRVSAPKLESILPASDITADAEAIIEKYQNTGPSVQSQVKRGCFMYFFLALALVGVGVAALYLYTVRKQ